MSAGQPPFRAQVGGPCGAFYNRKPGAMAGAIYSAQPVFRYVVSVIAAPDAPPDRTIEPDTRSSLTRDGS